MKIAVWHNLPSGGGKRALYGQVEGLIKRGHLVEAWCPDTADAEYLPLSKLITEHRLPFRPAPRRRSLVGRMLARRHGDRFLNEMNRHSQICAEAILQGGFDLVFAAPCRFFFVPRLGHFLQRCGLPLCLYLQEPFRSRYEAMPELPWLALAKDSAQRSLVWRALRRVRDQWHNHRLRTAGRLEWEDARSYNLILANSYFSRESIARALGLDARVCYLGYDADRFRRANPPPPREQFIIGIGSMHFIKGVDTAIRAVALLPLPRPPLVWVANTESHVYRRDMEALAAHEQVDLQIKSRIDDETLVDLLNRASLLLYTSRLEPFGYAPIEANACGLPVVAVAEGGIRETVIDHVNGLLCDRDPGLLAQAMQRLLHNPDLASQLAAAGAQKALDFWAPGASIDRLEAHLHALVQTKQTR